jgi:hypothetical protein
VLRNGCEGSTFRHGTQLATNSGQRLEAIESEGMIPQTKNKRNMGGTLYKKRRS